jgi:hypothetical protein
MDIKETIEKFTTENGFEWGINTAMQVLRPNCHYQLSCSGGNFIITDWPQNQWDDINQTWVEAPTSQEIRDEYIRLKTISECIEYFKTNK